MHYIRFIRSTLLEQYQTPIVESSRLRGMPERYILFQDILKPTILPIIPLLGLSIGSLIGGTVVIENLFDIPGLGYFLVDSIKSRDYPVIQGCVLFIGFFVVIINTIADLLSLSSILNNVMLLLRKKHQSLNGLIHIEKKVVTMKFKLSRKTLYFSFYGLYYMSYYITIYSQ